MQDFRSVLEVNGPIFKRLLEIKNEMQLIHLTNTEFIEMIFVGGLYLLDSKNEKMIDFVRANALLDN